MARNLEYEMVEQVKFTLRFFDDNWNEVDGTTRWTNDTQAVRVYLDKLRWNVFLGSRTLDLGYPELKNATSMTVEVDRE